MKTTPVREGFFFHRPEKVGSTTMVGIVMRLAQVRAHKQLGKQGTPDYSAFCTHRSNHGTALSLEYGQRNRNKSFLFSILRDPTARTISRWFHFGVSFYQHDPTLPNFLSALRAPNDFMFYLKDLMVKNMTIYNPKELSRNVVNYTEIVENILDAYDFIAITERMDESLVVLKLLLGLSFEEILYAHPARSAGGYSNGVPNKRPCIYITPSFLSPGMKKYLQSPEWKRRIKGDEMLYMAAYKSLDLTIEYLGKERVQRQVELFQRAKAYAQTQCESKIVDLCDENGRRRQFDNTTCLIWGEGCDHVCLNELKLPAEFSEE
jgi:hypothetical protein